MTENEKKIIKNEILQELLLESRLIEELMPVSSVQDTDKFELDGGRYV